MDEEKVSTFMAVTGAEKAAAEQMLGAFEGDVERAINFYLENEGAGGSNMTDADAQLAQRLMQEDDRAMAIADEPEPVMVGPPATGTGRGHVPMRTEARVEEPEDVMDLANDDNDDEDVMLRTMAAHRAAGIAAAREAERTMEAMMNMTRGVLGGAGLPSVFPGIGPPNGSSRARVSHPITFDNDDDTDDVQLLQQRPSRRGDVSGLSVQGTGVRRGLGTRASGSARAGLSRPLSNQNMQIEEPDSDEDADLALAKRLQAEEHSMAAGLPSRASAGVGRQGPTALSSGGGSSHALRDDEEEDEQLGLGVDRHELEEARMIEAAMLGIPYEPRLPARVAAAAAAPADPELAEHRNLRWEQDQAFEESLAADRSKAEAAARAERDAREAEERQRQQEEAARQAAEAETARVARLLSDKAASLPKEPQPGQEGSLNIVVRLPDGSRLNRRFNSTDMLKSVFDFVDVQHNAATIKPGTYRLVNSYPRKVFEESEARGTLADYGITADTALFLEQSS